MGAFLLKRWINCRALSRLGFCKLSPSETLSERTFEHLRLAIAEGNWGEKSASWRVHRNRAGDPSTFLRKEKTSKLGRMIGMDFRTERLAIAKGDRPSTTHPSQVAGHDDPPFPWE